MDDNKKARMRRAQRMALHNGRQDRVFTVTYEEGSEKDGREVDHEPDGVLRGVPCGAGRV
jgi:hypothetical protein